MVKTYVILRLSTFFILVPSISLFWNKKSMPDQGMLANLMSFDALHFRYIAEHGYTHEKNHAFFPGYPIMLHHLNMIAGAITSTY